MAGIIASKGRKTRGEEVRGETGEEGSSVNQPQVWVIATYTPIIGYNGMNNLINARISWFNSLAVQIP